MEYTKQAVKIYTLKILQAPKGRWINGILKESCEYECWKSYKLRKKFELVEYTKEAAKIYTLKYYRLRKAFELMEYRGSCQDIYTEILTGQKGFELMEYT